MKQLFARPLEIFNFMQALKLKIVLSRCKRHLLGFGSNYYIHLKTVRLTFKKYIYWSYFSNIQANVLFLSKVSFYPKCKMY